MAARGEQGSDRASKRPREEGTPVDTGVAALRARIEELETGNAALRARIEELEVKNDTLRGTAGALALEKLVRKDKVDELEQRQRVIANSLRRAARYLEAGPERDGPVPAPARSATRAPAWPATAQQARARAANSAGMFPAPPAPPTPVTAAPPAPPVFKPFKPQTG